MSARYHVFTRTWWAENPEWPNGLEPCAGDKDTQRIFYTEQYAQDYCADWNRTHESGRLSLKCEYEEV